MIETNQRTMTEALALPDEQSESLTSLTVNQDMADMPAPEPPVEEAAEPQPEAAARPSPAGDLPVQPEPVEPSAAPALPSVPTEDAEDAKNAYWSRVLTGDPATVPVQVRRQAGAEEWSLPEEQREYRLLSTLNRSWAADHLPYTREEISSGWQQQRAQLTRELGVQDNEHELFLALSQKQVDDKRREVAKKIFDRCYMAGLDGGEQVDATEWEAELSEDDALHAKELADMAYRQGQEVSRQYRTLAEQVARGMDAFAAVEEDAIAAPRVLASMPDLLKAVDALAELDDTQRHTVLYLTAGMMRREQSGEAGSLPVRAVQAVRRGISRLSTGMLQAAANASIASMNQFGKRWGMEKLSDTAEAWDKRMQVLESLRRLSQDELRPLVLPEEADGAASYLITAAEAVPSALLSCCGGAGFAALTLGAVGDSVAEARQRAPMASQELQLYAGLLAGAIQAGIYMNLNRVGGRLLEQSISRIGRASGQGIAGYTLAGLNVMGSATTEAAKMLAAGKLAKAADLGAQEMAARLSKTASNIDWQEFGSNLTDIEANMHEAAALLPFLLVGSGRLALQHFRSPRAILGDGKMLEDWGVSAQQQEAILVERNPELQSRLLREALSGSKLWGGAGFVPAATRALRLLHSDSFSEFKNVKHVCDFLQLSEEAIAAEAKRTADSEATELLPRSLSTPDGDRRYAAAVNLWNEWWGLSRKDRTPDAYPSEVTYTEVRNTPLERSMDTYFSLERLMVSQLPRRLREPGVYAPFAEQERRTLLNSRIADLKGLSYQFLMGIYAVDSLARDSNSEKAWRAKAERSRKGLLGAVARAVVSTARGVPRDVAMQNLRDYVTAFYARRKYKGTRPEWLVKTSYRTVMGLPENLEGHSSDKWENQTEYRDAMRLYLGVRTHTDALIDLLPLTADFQTALTRGLSPDQAYSYLLSRELGLPESLYDTPTGREGETLRNATPMVRYTRENLRKFRAYRQLTGRATEKVIGDDAAMYFRARRPDGSYTHWHARSKQAVNDVVGNASLFFMPFGHTQNMQQRLVRQRKSKFSLMDNPVAEAGVFSTYDQLCSLAMHDLGRQWKNTAIKSQPGLGIGAERTFFRSTYGTDGVTPLISEQDIPGAEFGVYAYSDVTPLSMAQSRFYVYWQRMLRSGYVTPEQVGDFLVERRFLSSKERSNLLRDVGADEAMPEGDEDSETHAVGMADKMAEYTTLRFLAQLPRLPFPRSVKEWVGMAAFCPEPEVEKEETGRASKRVTIGKGGTGIITWANRVVAEKLRRLAPMVDQVRKNIPAKRAQNEFFRMLLNDAMGLDDTRSYEQGWCFRVGGAPAVQCMPQTYWNLLRSPKRGWELLDEPERKALRSHLEEFCRREPLFTHPDVPTDDPVQTAIETLDGLLQEYPLMHRYGTVSGDDKRVRLIAFDQQATEPAAEDEPYYTPMPLFADGEMEAGCAFRTTTNIPDFIAGDSRVMPGLALLDMLRSYSANLPHAYEDGIWWQGERYGLHGKTPTGLEAYKAERPLQSLIRLLQDMGEREKEHGVMKICGIEVPGLKRDLDLRPFQAITVYRSPENREWVYRLMPGDATMQNPTMRSPYLVHCRGGVYLSGNTAVRQAEDMEGVYNSLQDFRPQDKREYTRHGKKWAEEAWQYNLEQAVRYSLRTNFLKSEQNQPAYMMEFLMRLMEDSGFALGIEEKDPSTFTPGQAQLLSLARDMIAHICAPEEKDAYRRLAKTAKIYRRVPSRRRPMIEALKGANDEVSDEFLDMVHIINDEVKKAFDEVEEPPQPAEDAADSAEEQE